MNERIKELANIAAGRSIKTSPALASDMADWAVIEKFAELIAKECADLCSDLDGGENMFSRGIRSHFGVE